MSRDYKTAIQMMGRIRNILTREYHIFINSRAHDLPIHKEEVDKSIIDIFRALSGCRDPLVCGSLVLMPRLTLYKKTSFIILMSTTLWKNYSYMAPQNKENVCPDGGNQRLITKERSKV